MNRKLKKNLIVISFVVCFLFLVVSYEPNNFFGIATQIISLMGIFIGLYSYFSFSVPKEIFNDGSDIENDIDDKASLANEFYNELQALILNVSKELNKDYKLSIYLKSPGGYKLQNSTCSTFPKILEYTNKIIKEMQESNDLTFYQKDYVASWDDIFKEKNYNGSEVISIYPISHNEHDIGILISKINHFNKVAERDSKIISYMSEILSFFMKDLNMIDNLEEDIDNQKKIISFFSEIDLKYSEKELLSKFQGLIKKFIKYDALTISKINNNGLTANIHLYDGAQINQPTNNEFNTNGTLHGLSYINKKITNEVITSDSFFRFEAIEKIDSRSISILSIPVLLKNNIIGLITLEEFSNNKFSLNSEKALQVIAKLLGTSIYWQNEYENIFQDAIRDGMTGLLNHKTFIDRAFGELERANRFQNNLVILMYDLDKFKRVNDTLGHPYGDYVIKTVAEIMKDNVRSIDLVSRYGGEEFAIVLVNPTPDMAIVVAERIINSVASYNFSFNGKEVRLTISAGLSSYPSDAKDMYELLDYADKGLYRSKKSGGNCITIFNSIDESSIS